MHGHAASQSELRLDGPDIFRILVVEDNPTDVLLLHEATRSPAKPPQFDLTEAVSLAECLRKLDGDHGYHLVLTDLRLGDSVGLETLYRIQAAAPGVPVVVLTGMGDESAGVEAVRRGAQDYLVKVPELRETLARRLRFAIERHRHSDQERRAAHEGEFAQVERLGQTPSTEITRHYYLGGSLREAAPELFEKWVGEYRNLLNDALQRRAYKMASREDDPVSVLAEQMGQFHAGPRDITEVHVVATRTAITAAPLRSQAYVEEGRLLVLDLMGRLANFYRRFHPAVRPRGGER